MEIFCLFVFVCIQTVFTLDVFRIYTLSSNKKNYICQNSLSFCFSQFVLLNSLFTFCKPQNKFTFHNFDTSILNPNCYKNFFRAKEFLVADSFLQKLFFVSNRIFFIYFFKFLLKKVKFYPLFEFKTKPYLRL